MEYQNVSQDGPSTSPPAPPTARKAVGRARRIAASVAAATVLLGGGVAIGIALTGGASAATTSNPGATSSGAASGKCQRLAERALSSGHPLVARRLHLLCANPLVRLATGGGIHGQVTFRSKTGTKTIAFERGTVQSVAGSVVTVQAVDGTRWTWDIVSNTQVRQSGQQVAQGKLAVGDQVLVAGPVVAGTNDARLIRISPAG